jgi:hypothetical protein
MSIDIFLLSPEETDRTLRSILVSPSTQDYYVERPPSACVAAVMVEVAAAVAVSGVRGRVLATVTAKAVVAIACY